MQMDAQEGTPIVQATPGTRCVLVAGGSSGIGAAIARGFAAAGDAVSATGASQPEVESADADPANQGIAFAVLDVRNGESVKDVLKSAQG